MPTLGNRIRHLRIKSGLSIGSLEKILGINNIQKYEVGSVRPGSDAIIALANFFSVSCDWLLLGEKGGNFINQGKYNLDEELEKSIDLLQKIYQDRGPTVREWAIFTFKDTVKKYID